MLIFYSKYLNVCGISSALTTAYNWRWIYWEYDLTWLSFDSDGDKLEVQHIWNIHVWREIFLIFDHIEYWNFRTYMKTKNVKKALCSFVNIVETAMHWRNCEDFFHEMTTPNSLSSNLSVSFFSTWKLLVFSIIISL